jgi:hypothetical protein
MPVLLAGYGIAGAGAAGVSNNLRLLTALEHSSFPQELLA